jgi:hypothetical protein
VRFTKQKESINLAEMNRRRGKKSENSQPS